MSDGLRSNDEIERLVRLIDGTPREKAVEMMVGQLRSGVSYRNFLSAVFVAAERFKASPHMVLMVNSANRLSLDLHSEHLLIPMF